jgi:hypothetical protein
MSYNEDNNGFFTFILNSASPWTRERHVWIIAKGVPFEEIGWFRRHVSFPFLGGTFDFGLGLYVESLNLSR